MFFFFIRLNVFSLRLLLRAAALPPGSHGDAGDLQRAAGLRPGLRLPAEGGRGRSGGGEAGGAGRPLLSCPLQLLHVLHVIPVLLPALVNGWSSGSITFQQSVYFRKGVCLAFTPPVKTWNISDGVGLS